LAILAGVLALIGIFVQQPAALSAPDLPVAALGMAVLMEVKGVNSALNSGTLFTIQDDTTSDTIDEIDK